MSRRYAFKSKEIRGCCEKWTHVELYLHYWLVSKAQWIYSYQPINMAYQCSTTIYTPSFQYRKTHPLGQEIHVLCTLKRHA
jgi:hypothetical protein